MKTIGILTAMSVEYRQLASIMTDAHEEIDGIQKYLIGNIGKHRIVLVECGIGKVNSAVGCMLLIQRYQPDQIISTGVAGGVDMSINVMDVVVSTSQVYHDVWCGPGNAWGQVQGLPEQYQSNTEINPDRNLVADAQGNKYGNAECGRKLKNTDKNHSWFDLFGRYVHYKT